MNKLVEQLDIYDRAGDIENLAGALLDNYQKLRNALQAGQAMRDEIVVTRHNPTGYIAEPHGSAHSFSAGEAALAWDAAIGDCK